MDREHDRYYRALVARDARFDGLFFVGVKTTGIYCRPVCTARTPGQDRCRFFPCAAAAEAAGFRPCLRCRPELAPGHAPVDAVGRLARAAAARIEAGALDHGGGLEQLANDLGMCSRQLRRAVRRELGVSPVQLVQTHRLLLAKHLLSETQLPIIEVAFAAGFQSVRRFNALFSSRYRLAPSRFRRAAAPSPPNDVLRLHVAYRPPLAWRELLEFIAPRAIGGIERVEGGTYLRTVSIDGHQGWLKVALGAKPNTLAVEFSAPLVPALGPLLARVRRLFDLGARPDAIAGHLARDRRIGAAVKRCPGVRVPGAFDGFEFAWRAILGQLVSVRAAGTLAARLALEFGATIDTPDPLLNRLTPSPERLAEAAPRQFVALGIARPRGVAMIALARAVADGGLRLEPGADPQFAIDQLKSLPGIGEWTAQYIAMRALSWPDAFPAGDLGLRRGLKEPSKARLLSIAEAWRPWRAYAALHVWRQ